MEIIKSRMTLKDLFPSSTQASLPEFTHNIIPKEVIKESIPEGSVGSNNSNIWMWVGGIAILSCVGYLIYLDNKRVKEKRY
jgi:hypothetical protein